MNAAAQGPYPPESSSAMEGVAVVALRVAASAEQLRLVRGVVQEAVVSCGCGEVCASDIVSAVDEACQNVIRHAYGARAQGDILIDIRRDDDLVLLNIVDYAPPVDPGSVKPRALEELRPGGLGTYFISERMDAIEFREPPVGAGNRLWMAKRIE